MAEGAAGTAGTVLKGAFWCAVAGLTGLGIDAAANWFIGDFTGGIGTGFGELADMVQGTGGSEQVANLTPDQISDAAEQAGIGGSNTDSVADSFFRDPS